MSITIQHATVFTPEDIMEDAAVQIDEGRIVAVGNAPEMVVPENAMVVDGTDLLLTPGFIELQLNGGFGHDFTDDPETIWLVAEQMVRHGVTSFLPTIVTSPFETVNHARQVIHQNPHLYRGAIPIGLHVEGPFLNPAKKGAHNPEYLRLPVPADHLDWSADTGVRMVTLSPELDGALDLISALNERGVVVSAGHSMATFERAMAGFDAGVSYGTHLFNAMRSLHHREPGLAGALLFDERITIGLIVDGIHVHPSLVKIIWQIVGSRLNLISDAIAATGMPPGEYRLGSHDIIVSDSTSRLADGTLAGSVLMLDEALRHLIGQTGCSISEALKTVTSTPAKLLGFASMKGNISPGYDADLVLLTPELEVVATIVGGELVYANKVVVGV